MRDRLTEYLKRRFASATIPNFRDGIICQTEFATEPKSTTPGVETSSIGKGRIDILIRDSRGMLLGIENKMWAVFQDGQPLKYFPTLKALAEKQTVAEKHEPRVCVLLPQHREREARDHLKIQGLDEQRCPLLYWDEIVKYLEDVSKEDAQDVAAVARFLIEYVKSNALETALHMQREHVCGIHAGIGTDFQGDFLDKLKPCFPNPGAIKQSADQWIGFHFPSYEGQGTRQNWFGFVRHGERGVGIGMNIFLPPEKLDGIPDLQASGPWKLPFVHFEEFLNDVSAWKDRLQPILKRIQEVATKIDTEAAQAPDVSSGSSAAQ